LLAIRSLGILTQHEIPTVNLSAEAIFPQTLGFLHFYKRLEIYYYDQEYPNELHGEGHTEALLHELFHGEGIQHQLFTPTN